MRNSIATFSPWFDNLFESTKTELVRFMRTDILENEESYIIKIDVPEVNKEQLKVKLVSGYLTVEVNIPEEALPEGTVYLQRERKVGTFSRSYYVGNNVKLENVSAKLDNGVLALTIRKTNKEEQEKEHLVTIE